MQHITIYILNTYTHTQKELLRRSLEKVRSMVVNSSRKPKKLDNCLILWLQNALAHATQCRSSASDPQKQKRMGQCYCHFFQETEYSSSFFASLSFCVSICFLLPSTCAFFVLQRSTLVRCHVSNPGRGGGHRRQNHHSAERGGYATMPSSTGTWNH